MFLETAGGDSLCDGHFHRFANDGCLVLAEGEQYNLAGFQDTANTHGECHAGNIFLTKKSAGGIAAGDRIEGYPACARVAAAAWLIESYVAGATYTQNLQIDSAGFLDFSLIAQAVILDGARRGIALGDVDIFFENVHMIEKSFVHPTVVAVGIDRAYRVVFIKVEGDHPAEI